MRLPMEAPASGYVTNILKCVYQQQGKPQHTDIRDDMNYFFRVRVERDEENNLISALYGKIHGDFRFDYQRRLSFTYYLNPESNDRNVEFDPSENLLKGLLSREVVNTP